MLRKLSFRTLAMLLAIVMMFSISVNATDAVPEGESVADVSAAEAVEALESLDALEENAGEVIDGVTNGDAEIMANDPSLSLTFYQYSNGWTQTVTYTPSTTASTSISSELLNSTRISPPCIDYELQSIEFVSEEQNIESGNVDINALQLSNNWIEVDVSQHPYSKVARLTIEYDANANGSIDLSEKNYGTAYLIGPNVMLTAAHNVYSETYNTFFDIDVCFGAVGNQSGTVVSPNFAIVDSRYISTESSSYDWALLLLGTDAAAGNYFGIGTIESGNIASAIGGTDVTISGYFKPSVDAELSDNRQRICSGEVNNPRIDLVERRFSYEIQTYEGLSGSPVYVDDAFLIAWGIHTMGGDGSSGSGVVFTPIMYQYFCYHIDNGRSLYNYPRS